MKPLSTQPNLTQQVYEAIVEEICDGNLQAGAHLVQEDLAERLGVSRQPIQQAMTLLKADGMVMEIGRRGLQVTPLDLTMMRHHYDIRAALDGLSVRMCAARAASDPVLAGSLAEEGRTILQRGEEAVASGAVGLQVREDEAFHNMLYAHSGNPLLARAAEPHWRYLRRAMGEVLRHAEPPREIWRQHAEILEAVTAGDQAGAEELAVAHDLRAAETLNAALVIDDVSPAAGG